MNINETIAKIETLEGVESASFWDKVEGKERIYIVTEKFNGGKNWNGGKGHGTCYIDINSGEVVMNEVAGAKTRDRHEEMGTRESLEEIASEILSGNQ